MCVNKLYQEFRSEYNLNLLQEEKVVHLISYLMSSYKYFLYFYHRYTHSMKLTFVILFLFSLLFHDGCLFSQSENITGNPDLKYDNAVYRDSIYTPLLYRNGGELTYPVIELNSDETLYLGFDEFSNETEQYYYTIVQCNYDWTPSSLSPLDYIDGFVENPLTSFEFSFNTLVPYIHYSLIIPNENIKPKVSGNYIIIIYTSEFELVLTRRFMVYEPLCEVDATVRKTSVIEKMKSHQEIDFTIKTSAG